jgi:hypothetical protein
MLVPPGASATPTITSDLEGRPGGIRLIKWLMRFVRPGGSHPPEVLKAREVIAAIDAGGVPLNPLRINEIARNLGLEVSRKAPVDETIQRIRAAVHRARPYSQ